ncbi:hypothetical protein IAI53_12445 [Thauera sp. CAU 1555]|uniref:Transmembrane protein n=1 Tax=Thauera sedimentorum TaxID=2767595 RepID=A0ABR9BBX2_9RHOO|nr:hypothetical protein [Thauera sedimentorum]MBC9072777.1 hypothetical protein [Thauera sedimentorum]MBD8503696.1 hypothetical protein [Thauera sedimentorum]
MSTIRAFRQTFAAAVAVGVIDWALPLAVAEKTMYAGSWIGYLLLVAFGFLAIREGSRYRYVLRHTWAFVGFWFALGVLSFTLGRTDVPPEDRVLGLQGYLFATVLFLPVAFASSSLGAAIAHFLAKLRHDRPDAA